MSLRPRPIRPRVVAVATDGYLTPTYPFEDLDLPPGWVPYYGQDITSGTGRAAPGGKNVGDNEADLKERMDRLVGVFAANDTRGMARRLFDRFLAKQSRVVYFNDADLNAAAAAHPNIRAFNSALLALPGGTRPAAGRVRFHQALRAAKWDIDRLQAPTDLGVPAFNSGNKFFSTGDFGNGLGLMINGVQHVYAVATHYTHYPDINRYAVTIRYYYYDVFGLDDDDLAEYGSDFYTPITMPSRVGITAWWQLQHQYGYAPLVTRIVLEHTVEAPTT